TDLLVLSQQPQRRPDHLVGQESLRTQKRHPRPVRRQHPGKHLERLLPDQLRRRHHPHPPRRLQLPLACRRGCHHHPQHHQPHHVRLPDSCRHPHHRPQRRRPPRQHPVHPQRLLSRLPLRQERHDRRHRQPLSYRHLLPRFL